MFCFQNYFLHLILFLFLLIKFTLPKLLNNIIKIGDEKFKYIHFNFSSNEDMIIDTSSYPVSSEDFLGLKKMEDFFLKNQIKKLVIIH